MQVNTVLGRIRPEELGKTLIHEHMICSSPEMMGYFHPSWNPPERVIPRCVEMLEYVKDAFGIKTIVDGTPLSLGRDLDLLKAISEQAEINIIASTGFYIYDCFSAGRVEPALLARSLVEEIENGRIAPGFLKCAVEQNLTNCQKNYIAILSHIHHATGLPIFAHSSSAGKSGHAILDEFARYEVPFSRIIIGHTGDTLDISYPLSLLERGANISIDRISGDGKKKGELAGELIKMGYAEKIFLAHDAICFDDNANFPENACYDSYDPERLGVIHKYILPSLVSSGIPEEAFEKIFVENVQRLFL